MFNLFIDSILSTRLNLSTILNITFFPLETSELRVNIIFKLFLGISIHDTKKESIV